MGQNPKPKTATERGDAILKRMLTTKPKQHKEIVEERKAKKPQDAPKAAKKR
jgi:hypothetical protein